MTPRLLLPFVLSLSLFACDEETENPDPGNTCTTSSLTYANFGEAFFSDNCTSCHAADSANRRGAPPAANWDSLSGVQAGSAKINARAAQAPQCLPPLLPINHPPKIGQNSLSGLAVGVLSSDEPRDSWLAILQTMSRRFALASRLSPYTLLQSRPRPRVPTVTF
ncbi:MAG: hypothetical protein JKY56_08085 [Kofleriaceae bacterium]|nr:hypothetical protein [Kofleriaceae bacterium]